MNQLKFHEMRIIIFGLVLIFSVFATSNSLAQTRKYRSISKIERKLDTKVKPNEIFIIQRTGREIFYPIVVGQKLTVQSVSGQELQGFFDSIHGDSLFISSGFGRNSSSVHLAQIHKLKVFNNLKSGNKFWGIVLITYGGLYIAGGLINGLMIATLANTLTAEILAEGFTIFLVESAIGFPILWEGKKLIYRNFRFDGGRNTIIVF